MFIRRALVMMLIRLGKANMRPKKGETPADLARRVRPDVKGAQKFASYVYPPPNTVERKDVTLGGRPTWHFAPKDHNGKTILMIHGGAYFLGLEHLSNSYTAYSMYLADVTKAEVYAIEYRLVPEFKLIDALDDCVEAYKELLKKGIKPEDLIVTGDSAGGNLTLGLLLRLKDEGLPMPAGAIPVSAGTDLTASGASWEERAHLDPMLPKELKDLDKTDTIGDMAPDHPYVSPLFGDYKGLPPLLMFVGGREVLYDDTIRVAEKAKAVGVDVTLDINEKMFHAYPVFAGIFKEGMDALHKMKAFIDRVTK